MTIPAKRSRFSTGILILGILLIAVNLRAPVTGIGAVLDQVITSLQLNASEAGMLTTLPLLAFALASPLATALASKQGLEVSLFFALTLIAGGLASRLIDSVAVLYIGTAVIGVGIAIGNVLLPGIVKRDFPHRIAVMTSAYVLSMGIFSGSYAALLIPIAAYQNMGWRIALACFGLVTLVSILVWLAQLKSPGKPVKSLVPQHSEVGIWHHPLAWHITLLLGLNSFYTYVMLAWLPSMLLERGIEAQQAGALQGLFQFSSALPGILLIPLLAKLNDQRILTFGLATLGCFCSLGFLYLPSYAFIWSAVLGFCSGAVFILGISFIGLRTANSGQATSLSGMAQFIGYLLAATGPIIAGWLHGYFGNWSSVLWLCAFVSLLSAVFGYLGGRKVTISAKP